MKHICECFICGHKHERQVPPPGLNMKTLARKRTALMARRLWSKVQKTRGCWLWTGKAIRGGYGAITVLGKPMTAHRVAWELFYGQIPEGMNVCHRCDNKLCCNPHHLFIGTHQDNLRHAELHGLGRYPAKPLASAVARAFNPRMNRVPPSSGPPPSPTS